MFSDSTTDNIISLLLNSLEFRTAATDLSGFHYLLNSNNDNWSEGKQSSNNLDGIGNVIENYNLKQQRHDNTSSILYQTDNMSLF